MVSARGPRPRSPPRSPASHLRGENGAFRESSPTTAGGGLRGTQDSAYSGPNPAPRSVEASRGCRSDPRSESRPQGGEQRATPPPPWARWAAGGLRAGGSALLKARTPGTGEIRWRPRYPGAAVRAAMLLSRFFDACGAAPPPQSAETSGSSRSTAAVTGAACLGELPGATVLWAARTERPPRRSLSPRHLPPEAAGCVWLRLGCQ